MTSQRRFIADAMLERLARWLRVLGEDTAFVAGVDDGDLVQLANREKRVILTRDRGLLERKAVGEHLLVRSEEPIQQVREVVHMFSIPLPRELFTRCLMCNVALRPATLDEISSQVPERSRVGLHPYMCCPRCGRLYWHGSHARRMRSALRAVFTEEDESA